MVALLALLCGCSPLQAPRDTPPRPPSPPAASVPPSAADTGPSAEAIARANPKISPAVARAIEDVIRQPSDNPRAAVLDLSAPRARRDSTWSSGRMAACADLPGVARTRLRGIAPRRLRRGVLQRPQQQRQQPRPVPNGQTYLSEVYAGLAMRMDGLSPTNSNARSRYIVVHAARYMESESWNVKKAGRPRLSDGCSCSRRHTAMPSCRVSTEAR